MNRSNPASPTMTFDESTVKPLIANIVRLMETKCIGLNGSRPDWRALFAAEFDRVKQFDSRSDFEARVSSVLARGGLSHVAFFHESGQRAPARYAINATFTSDPDVPGRWIFQDVHEGEHRDHRVITQLARSTASRSRGAACPARVSASFRAVRRSAAPP